MLVRNRSVPVKNKRKPNTKNQKQPQHATTISPQERTFWAESVEKQGATFFFTLAQVEKEDTALAETT